MVSHNDYMDDGGKQLVFCVKHSQADICIFL